MEGLQRALHKRRIVDPDAQRHFQRMSPRPSAAPHRSLRSWLCNSSALARMLGGTLTRPLFVVYSGLKSSSRNSAGSCRARKP